MASFDSSLTNQDSRWSHDRAFIQQTIAPQRYTTRPPSIHHPTAVYKKLDADLTYVISQMPGPTVPPKSCIVPNGRGLLTWFPKDGVESVYHMGIIPQGSFVNRELTAGFAQGFVANSLANTSYTLNGVKIVCGLYGLHFTKALAVPRLDAPVKIAPELSESFSRSRLYGGMFRAWSNTVAIGNTALNGSVTASVISDTRDVAQNETGSDAFAVVDQAQSARTVKEIVKEISANTGVVTVQGSDISPDFKAPDALNNVRIEGGWTQSVTYNTINRLIDLEYLASAGPNQVHNLFSSWYSPWGVNQKEGFGVDTIPETVANTYSISSGILPSNANVIPSLSEMGTLRVKFDIGAYITNLNLTNTGSQWQLISMVEHVFVGISNSQTGALQVNILRTTKMLVGATSELFPKTPNVSQWQKNAWMDFGHVSDITDQYIAQGGLSVVGKFVGVKISAFFCANLVSAPASATPFNVICGSYSPYTTQAVSSATAFVDSIQGPQVGFFASDINVEGKCGPCHIIRYDNIGENQTFRVSGMFNTESVAKGDLAPYVQDQVMNSRLAPDVNVLPLVYMLFNSNSPFKMSWNAQEYDDFIEKYVKNINTETMTELADSDSRIKAAMQAAGLFNSIPTGLGSAVGADGALHLMGASGQFGEDAAVSASGNLSGYRRTQRSTASLW